MSKETINSLKLERTPVINIEDLMNMRQYLDYVKFAFKLKGFNKSILRDHGKISDNLSQNKKRVFEVINGKKTQNNKSANSKLAIDPHNALYWDTLNRC